MDNPHYVTPEEADKMSCPMQMNGTRYPKCHGPSCMAWRWGRQEAQTGYRIIEHFDNESRVHINYEHSATHGYCGMVRS
jgi:hypothetical protein